MLSRLRKDAALWSVPRPPRPGTPKKRDPKPTYGKEALSWAKRAAHGRARLTEVFCLHGEKVAKTYKTILATYKPAGGLIRVVLVREREGWVAIFRTDPNAPVAQILDAVAARATIEQDFHDLKAVPGAGEQQVRHYWAHVAVYHLNLWLHTLIELWAWDHPQTELCDRSASPWDVPTRRPSHADRRNALRRQCLAKEFQAVPADGPRAPRFGDLCRRLVKMLA